MEITSWREVGVACTIMWGPSWTVVDFEKMYMRSRFLGGEK